MESGLQLMRRREGFAADCDFGSRGASAVAGGSDQPRWSAGAGAMPEPACHSLSFRRVSGRLTATLHRIGGAWTTTIS